MVPEKRARARFGGWPWLALVRHPWRPTRVMQAGLACPDLPLWLWHFPAWWPDESEVFLEWFSAALMPFLVGSVAGLARDHFAEAVSPRCLLGCQWGPASTALLLVASRAALVCP